MTDEQIEQNAEKYADQFVSRCFCGEWNEVILRFTAGAHSRDDEVNDLLSQLEDKDGYIAYLRKELDKLRHPWISVEERLPDEHNNSGESVEVLGWFHDDYICKCKCMPEDNIWLIDEHPIEINPLYWMSIPESNKE